MRALRAVVACAAVATIAICADAAMADQMATAHTVTVDADQIDYYSDAAVLQATGHVRVALPTGAQVEGDLFTMNLSLRRLIVAGHVVLHTPHGEFAAAAYANFIEFGREYFVPLDPTADRWTYLNGDYVHPEKGRTMPGDAFFIPDTSGVRPYVIATRATVDADTYVKFTNARIAVLNGPRTPPLPSFVYNFSQNPDFSINSLSGATFDAPYAFAGSPTSLDAVHLRYDQMRAVKTYLSFEHHNVFADQAYVVLSLNPATQYDKQWNLVAYDRFGQQTAVAVNTQLFTGQKGILQPSFANGFADVQLVQALPESSLRFDVTQAYGTLLPGAGTPNHPVVAGLAWTSYDQRVGQSGITYRLQSGIGTSHDAFGVANSPLHDVWSRYLVAGVYSPVFSGLLGTSINVSLQSARTWTTFPNEIRTDVGTISAAKPLAPKLYAIGSATVAMVKVDRLNDVIVSPNLSTGFAPAPSSANGLPFFGAPTEFARTIARTYGLAATWQPSAWFQFQIAAQRSVYSPEQLPAPYQASAAFRTRMSKDLFATIGRTYYFNWQRQLWSPQFSLQVTAQ